MFYTGSYRRHSIKDLSFILLFLFSGYEFLSSFSSNSICLPPVRLPNFKEQAHSNYAQAVVKEILEEVLPYMNMYPDEEKKEEPEEGENPQGSQPEGGESPQGIKSTGFIVSRVLPSESSIFLTT